MAKQREKWIDCIKVLACVLVVLGHFFMSMIESEIISESPLLRWFIATIYYVHVPLFLICNGYLFQKRSNVLGWKKNILHKAVDLGVPYVVFSVITWVLKFLFSDSVNIQNDRLFVALFLQPISPYWYLYTLFFIYLVMPVFTTKKQAIIGLICALLLYIANLSETVVGSLYAIAQTAHQIIWFVLGMCFSLWDVPDKCVSRWWKIAALGMIFAFALLSVVATKYSLIVNLGMGMLGCSGIVLLVCNLTSGNWWEGIVRLLVKYTMPIFLMHTIFAAGIRVVLLKCSVSNVFVHLVLGSIVSFVCPIVAAKVMEKLKLDFIMYPKKITRYLHTSDDKG